MNETKGMRAAGWRAFALACLACLGVALACMAPHAAWADEPSVSLPAPDQAQPAVAPGSFEAAAPGEGDWSPDLGAQVEPLKAGDVRKGTVTVTASGAFHQVAARNMLDHVNAARIEAGVPAIGWSTSLEAIAQQRAAEIVYQFSHERPDHTYVNAMFQQAGISYSAVGENILYGTGLAGSYDANQLWKQSPGHYGNMVDPEFNAMGVGCFEFQGVYFWVEVFGGGVPATGVSGLPDEGSFTVPFEVAGDNLGGVFEDFQPNQWYQDGLVYSINNGLMYGYADIPRFGFYDDITRGQVATILYRMAGEPYAESYGFDDVDYGQYYGDAIIWARQTGVINGYAGTNSFGPDNSVTRQELAAMIANYASAIGGKDTSSNGSSLAALPDSWQVDDWARGSVAWCLDQEVMSGVQQPDGTRLFEPQGNAWRASLATMATRLYRDLL